MNKSRDSKDGTVEKEEVMACKSNAHTSNEGSERYGVRHYDGTKQPETGRTLPITGALRAVQVAFTCSA